jgi:hypothetical protein
MNPPTDFISHLPYAEYTSISEFMELYSEGTKMPITLSNTLAGN